MLVKAAIDGIARHGAKPSVGIVLSAKLHIFFYKTSLTIGDFDFGQITSSILVDKFWQNLATHIPLVAW